MLNRLYFDSTIMMLKLIIHTYKIELRTTIINFLTIL